MNFLPAVNLFIIRNLRRTILAAGLLLSPLSTTETHGAPISSQADTASLDEHGYRIDQPGTITFTVGVKISGKVEKPQVVIFLPKEKSLYHIETFDRSFIDELSQPLPFTPVIR